MGWATLARRGDVGGDSRGAAPAWRDITLFQGGGSASAPWMRVIPCVQRFTPEAERLTKRFEKIGGLAIWNG